MSTLDVKYHIFPFCLCCVSIIAEPGKNQIRSVRGKLLFNPKHKMTSFIKVIGTKPCPSKNCKRVFGGEEIRNYKLQRRRGFIWIKENTCSQGPNNMGELESQLVRSCSDRPSKI